MKQLYRWREWFEQPPGEDGRVRFVLVRGEHYECSQSSITAQLRVAATHCGYRVCAVDMDDRVSVVAVKRVSDVWHTEAMPKVTDSSVTVEVPFVRLTNVDVPATPPGGAPCRT